MKKTILTCLLIGAQLQAVNTNFWYALAAFASSRLAERTEQIIRKLETDTIPKGAQKDAKELLAAQFRGGDIKEALSRYATGIGFLSSAALLYYSLQEASKIN